MANKHRKRPSALPTTGQCKSKPQCETTSHPLGNYCLKKQNKKTTIVGKDVASQSSCGWEYKWCCCYEKQFDSLLKH